MGTKTFGRRTPTTAAVVARQPGAPLNGPSRRRPWRWITIALLLVVTGARIYPMLHSYLQSQQLMPHMDVAAMHGHAQELAVKYPRDPLARSYYGTTLAEQGRYADAEIELKAAMAEVGVLREQYSPLAESTVRATLGVVLGAERKMDEAKSVIHPACPSLSAPDFPASLRTEILKDKLCD